MVKVMRIAVIASCVLSTAIGLPAVASGTPILLKSCLVSLIEEAHVPAQQAGVLKEIAVKEGCQVKVGDLLAKIDDAQAAVQLKVASFEYEVAREEAANNIHVRYANAASKVTETEYQMNIEANRKVPGSVPMIEVQKLLLTYRRSVLEIEQAEINQRIATLQARVGYAKVAAAQENLERHLILSPLDAKVVELFRHVGEWVEPGDPVMHIVRINRLRVEGFLNIADINPSEVDNQPVKVSVKLARGSAADFTGKVVFVSPLVQAGGEYKIWAEVDNRTDPRTGEWIMQKGMDAEMTIESK